MNSDPFNLNIPTKFDTGSSFEDTPQSPVQRVKKGEELVLPATDKQPEIPISVLKIDPVTGKVTLGIPDGVKVRKIQRDGEDPLHKDPLAPEEEEPKN